MENITKGVILCGGWATRFMPECKCVPKELLPLYNKPILQYLVDDLIENGVTEICFVIRRGKEIIGKHFKPNKKWEKLVDSKLINEFEKYKNIKFKVVYQNKPLGTGHALLCAKNFCTSPFYLLNGDEVITNNPSTISQLKSAFIKHNSCVIGVKKVKPSEAYKYGMLAFEKSKSFKVAEIKEKPKQSDIPSLYSNLGCYIFTPHIFNYIAKNSTNQVPLTDAINSFIANKNSLYAVNILGHRYDMGNPLSFVFNNIEFCYNNVNTKAETVKFLQSLLKKWKNNINLFCKKSLI